jgi:hypothetical protein
MADSTTVFGFDFSMINVGIALTFNKIMPNVVAVGSI